MTFKAIYDKDGQVIEYHMYSIYLALFRIQEMCFGLENFVTKLVPVHSFVYLIENISFRLIKRCINLFYDNILTIPEVC